MGIVFDAPRARGTVTWICFDAGTRVFLDGRYCNFSETAAPAHGLPKEMHPPAQATPDGIYIHRHRDATPVEHCVLLIAQHEVALKYVPLDALVFSLGLYGCIFFILVRIGAELQRINERTHVHANRWWRAKGRRFETTACISAP